jgi:hypothetical protein
MRLAAASHVWPLDQTEQIVTYRGSLGSSSSPTAASGTVAATVDELILIAAHAVVVIVVLRITTTVVAVATIPAVLVVKVCNRQTIRSIVSCNVYTQHIPKLKVEKSFNTM